MGKQADLDARKRDKVAWEAQLRRGRQLFGNGNAREAKESEMEKIAP